MEIEVVSTWFSKARVVNQTSASYVSKVPTNTEPAADNGTSATGSAAINNGGGDSTRTGQNSLVVLPYGIGADDVTFNMQVIGWRVIGSQPISLLWVPSVLIDVACTAGTSTGVAGMQVLNTERFADTITVTTQPYTIGSDGNAHITNMGTPIVNSPANNGIAFVVVPLYGFQKFEFSFNLNSSATSCNALYAFI
jgi:hypothetical protein